MPLTPANNPTFSDSLPELTTNSVAHPDTWNPIHQALLDNDARLHQDLDTLGQSVADQVANLDGRLDGVESSSSVAVQRAVSLDWLYRGRRISFELFVAGYELRNHRGVSVISGVSGDDSIDVESTAGINAGEHYVLYDGEETTLVKVSAVLTERRLRLAHNLSRAWGSNATLTGSTLVARPEGGVTGREGDQWVSKAINLGDDHTARSIVIRREMSAANVRLFFRDEHTPEWTEAYWSVRRAGGGTTGAPSGMADYEYVIGMRGDGYIRIQVEEESVAIQHIVALGAGTELGGFVNPLMRPSKPVIVSPANGDVDVGETPTVTIGGYHSPAGNEFSHARILYSLSSDFSSILHDSGRINALTYSVPAGVIPEGSEVFQVAEVTDVAGLVSDRSDVTSFTSKSTYAYVNTPSILAPTNGQTEIPEQPTIQFSAFAVTGDEDTYKGFQLQIRRSGNTWDNPLHDSGLITDGKTNYTPPAGVIPADETRIVMRVRQEGDSLGFSEWSADVTVTTKRLFAQMIGIVRMTTGGGAGTWVRVNEKFEVISTNSATFDNHPVYAGITPQTIDGQAMIKVPEFYYKEGVIPTPHALAGMPFKLVSDQPAEGFSRHPAFMKSGSPIAQFWGGKYQGTADGSNKLGSKAGVKPLVSIDFPTMQSRAAARNVEGVSGFQLWDWYQLAAIKLLCLIEMGGADSQSLIGQGHVNGSAAENVDAGVVAQASWRGFVGLWGNVRQMVDGLRVDASGDYEIWDTQGNRSYIKTGQAAPSSYWITEMSTAKGENFDLGAMFVPSASDSTESNGTYGDYVYYSSGAERFAHHGGAWSNGSQAGLFYLSVSSAASSSSAHIGGRLAKV